MAWSLARERLGAELIGAREQVAACWRAAVRDQGGVAFSLLPLASELVLHAGAALADDSPPESPWRRCGGLLRIPARDGGGSLATELTILWRCMAQLLSGVACTSDEELRAREELGRQLDAALRGATAAVRFALLDEEPGEGALRFGGIVAVCWTTPAVAASSLAAHAA